MKKFASIVSGLAFSVLLSCSTETSPPKPNILFIPVDDLRPDLGCYGDTVVASPNIDKLAEQGIVFTRTYCQQAVCNPSRVSLLTGLRPDTLRVWDLRTQFRHNLPDVVTLPQYFKNNGYYVWGIGKIFHNIFPDTISWTDKPHVDGFPFDPDAVYLTEENLEKVEAKKQVYIEKGISRIDQLGHWYIKTVATEIADVDDDAYFDGAQTTAALKKMEELSGKNQPFFMAVGYYRPHLPFNAPKKYWDLYERENIPLAQNRFLPENSPAYAINRGRELRGYEDFRDLPQPEQQALAEDRQRLLKHGYYASVSYVDAQIGRLIAGLKKLGLYENTIIVIWGDHGWKLGEHNAWCKQTNYETDTRVPMIFSGAGVSAKSETSGALTEFVDIFPTLCEMAGLDVPGHLQGLSAAPLLENPDKPWKTAAFSQFLQGRFGQMYKGFEGKQFMGYAIRTNRYRYVEWYEWDKETDTKGKLTDRELYDHERDPQENKNIAGLVENAVLVKSLSNQLKKGWRAALPK
ncbi:MAG: sulfatase [Bacteroidales bacterium]|nr:sulfatase [Bacteroidales bacterium]MCF6341956.1 sulfatase [Bacteroidales bacterium]